MVNNPSETIHSDSKGTHVNNWQQSCSFGREGDPLDFVVHISQEIKQAVIEGEICLLVPDEAKPTDVKLVKANDTSKYFYVIGN